MFLLLWLLSPSLLCPLCGQAFGRRAGSSEFPAQPCKAALRSLSTFESVCVAPEIEFGARSPTWSNQR